MIKSEHDILRVFDFLVEVSVARRISVTPVVEKECFLICLTFFNSYHYSFPFCDHEMSEIVSEFPLIAFVVLHRDYSST